VTETILKLLKCHVAAVAEAVAAAQFARFGYDVSVQHGANQPEYDLVVACGSKLLAVSVKGSVDGGGGRQLSKLRKADYHGAARMWLGRFKPLTDYVLYSSRMCRIMKCPEYIWLGQKKLLIV
jgi:hypothetical protein